MLRKYNMKNLLSLPTELVYKFHLMIGKIWFQIEDRKSRRDYDPGDSENIQGSDPAEEKYKEEQMQELDKILDKVAEKLGEDDEIY